MTAQTGLDPALVESLLTDQRLLSVPVPPGARQSLLSAFAAVGERGLTASFFDSVNGSGTSLGTATFTAPDTGLKDKQGQPLKPNLAKSARFAGYLEVTTPGAYRFFVAFDKTGAEAELRFEHLDHLPGPFLTGVATRDKPEIGGAPDKYLELKPGVLYRFSFDVKNLSGGDVRLLVQAEALPKGSLSRLTLYPEAAVERAARALVLLRKVLQLAQGLNLNEREARYLLTHPADFGNLDLSGLPTRAGDDTPAGSQTLFVRFLRLAGYARLKREVAGGTDDLIHIFETTNIEEAYALLAKLMRREEATVKATARSLFVAPRFADELTVGRLWEALQVVGRFGVPVAAIVNWTRIVGAAATSDQRFAIARDLKEAIKARFETETWQHVAQPIFDKLRQRQRDALVAYVMHRHGFARLEQLYEYFLIDPGMEPVVQTSRIRLAISSVQLFTQRCLLNLEPEVHPSAVNSKQWEWMKRYRVWEANRKIFLFPENWLEPEFRDDKTHLFSELEGALFQGDVSGDMVEDAFLNYLRKLDEIARLDLLAMHLEDSPDPSLRTLHVIGRTHSGPYKYFYRRYAHQMWTPWEPISAQVEGVHLAPVVWRDRLYLFWVTFMEKAKPQGAVSVNPTRTITLPPLETEMEAQLHWSEYLEGEWHTPESGELNPPESQKLRASSADPRTVFIYVSKEPYEDGEERGVFINLSWPFGQAFYLAGRNSVPERRLLNPPPADPYSAWGPNAARYSGSGKLDVSFYWRVTTGPGTSDWEYETQSILREGRSYTLLPCDNDITLASHEIAMLVKPGFYQDNENTLFMEPTVIERTIDEWRGWVGPTRKEPGLRWPIVVLIPDVAVKDFFPVDPGDQFERPEFNENSLLQPREERDWLRNPSTGFVFGNEVIGPSGRAGMRVLSPDERAGGGTLVDLRTAPDSARSNAAFTTGDNTLQRDGLTLTGGGLNIVGSGGLTSITLQNLNNSFGSGGTS
jgi:hypothetical protein